MSPFRQQGCKGSGFALCIPGELRHPRFAMQQTEVCFAHFGQAEARTSGSHSSPQDMAEISFLLYTLGGGL